MLEETLKRSLRMLSLMSAPQKGCPKYVDCLKKIALSVFKPGEVRRPKKEGGR
jgi:hypothetical protein